MRFWTSDLHFGHANIIRYTQRPFADVQHMDEALIERWNATVGPDDQVMVVGDVALGFVTRSLESVSRLLGEKTLVPGNHDRCWSGQPEHRRPKEWERTYLDAGFAHIAPAPLEVEVTERLVTVSHFPYRGDSQQENRFLEQRPIDRGGWLFHGHTHGQWRQNDRMIDVGVDAWGGQPVSDDQLAELMAGGPRQLAPLRWEADRTGPN